MALRIHQSVTRGEIDNRKRGRVCGRVWILEREKPIELKLTGNCRRDLAGCFITFVNPSPTRTEDASDLALEQRGLTGDITASRKARVFNQPLEEAMDSIKKGISPPERMASVVYVEWFSEANGRVVIESADYTVKISPPAWTLSPEEEWAQIAAAQEAMRKWLERLGETRLSRQNPQFDPDEDKPMDEFGYEKLFRESDARTDKYMKLLEKYEGHPDQHRIVAREMGWEWLEEALEAKERGAIPPSPPMEVPKLEPNPLTEGVDWMRDSHGCIHHPLTKKTFESAMAMWHFCKNRDLLGEAADEDLVEMVTQFQITSAKLAGALNGLAYDADAREGGFIVASLKRALTYLNASMSAADRVTKKNLIPRKRLATFRAELFRSREEILLLMQRFRVGT